ncbi:Rpn14p [Sporobolomyces salmoneus]|uniref:Rpn14p n=1 Tax=Sporobolomyces salmoneus TaxID=183962 RepID=UPI00316F88B6
MTTPAMGSFTLPYIALQPSTSSVFADIANPQGSIAAENVWISFYSAEGKSLHGKIRVMESDDVDEGGVEVRVQEGDFEVKLVNSSTLEVSCDSLSIPATRLLLPSTLSNSPTSSSSSSTSEELPSPSFYSLSSGPIECFALSPDGRRLVLGSRDGQCRVVEVVKFVEGNGKERLRKGKEVALRGHVGDITCVEFFPSNEVVLTASTDMSLRVFSVSDGSSPRRLLGHTKRITSTHILLGGTHHKGREILSASLDGTIKLWDLSTGENTKTWTLSQPISKMEVISTMSPTEENVLEGRFAFCGHPNGTVSLVSLSPSSDTLDSSSLSVSATPITLFKTSHSSSIESMSYDPIKRLLATGTRNGSITLFRLPSNCRLDQLSQVEIDPLCTWKRTEGSSIRSVRWDQDGGGKSLLVASSDGLPYRASIELDPDTDTEKGSEEVEEKVRVRVLEEFVGLNCDPATGILGQEGGSGRVWVSGGMGDGSLRAYES